MQEPIVVGTDGSPGADAAIEWAADEAARFDRPLRVVHALDQVGHDNPFVSSPDAFESFSESGSRVLADAETLARKNHPELDITSEMLAERPAYALRRRAGGSFELVVGHRGAGGFSRLLVGSVGLNLAGHVPGPVVVVRDVRAAAHREVVVGADLSAGSMLAVEYAFEAAAARDALLRVVYAWPAHAGFSAHDAAVAAGRCAEQAVAPFRERFGQVEVVEHAPLGSPAAKLVEFSAHADLLVVGAHGRVGPHFGSVAHAAIHYADCPVAVVRVRT